MKVRIEEGGMYGQDMRFHTADKELSEVEFDAESVFDSKMAKLTAPGYGKLDIPGQYGNGSIYIDKKYLVRIPEDNPKTVLDHEKLSLQQDNARLRAALKKACYDKGRECFCGQHSPSK